MEVVKVKGNLRLVLAPKELVTLLTNNFLLKLMNGISDNDPRVTGLTLGDYITKNLPESKDYEFFVSIFELYDYFNKDCNFCFNLNTKFNIADSKISSIDDLCRYRDDPPDVIVDHKGKIYPFELKRYRGELTFDSLYSFVLEKIIRHYSEEYNYLILLQPEPNTKASFTLFKRLYERLKKENIFKGYLAFAFNNDNKEMVLVRVFPYLNQNKRPLKSGSEQLIDIINSK